ncbi:MAG: bifunctional phosphoribosyl-AMP cyclohydrolase/phosphoribosyl-ATP diphosphatase HisIE [Deltaproteobacteria bacterium]
MEIESLKFNEQGLIPVIVQDAQCGQALMFAYANRAALEKTIETKRAHFWSRSRMKLWQKGEESGNIQEVMGIFTDCDCDTVLYIVNQTGVACHTGARTCFFTPINGYEGVAPSFSNGKSGASLDEVYRVIKERRANPRAGSYVSGLFERGLDKILKKVGEEATETVIAAKNRNRDEMIYETADLWFHSLIALAELGITPEDIYSELGRRFGKPKEAYRTESK